MKKLVLLFSIYILLLSAQAQDRPVKNLIIMIPDGTSTSLLSLSRWYQYYCDSEQKSLAIDSILRGLVKTSSSDAPIGDSAPTTSCYMTGMPSNTAFVATYPVATTHDLFPIDSQKAYQPMATLFEAAKYYCNMATGIVVKCEFPHATPADCAAHTYNREMYPTIANQLIHNNLDIMIGGGAKFLSPENEMYLKRQNYTVIKNDYAALKNIKSGKLWALLDSIAMPYAMDVDTTKLPVRERIESGKPQTLAQLTQKALDLLSQNENGFILMVEGSLVDWAAHDNDAKTAIWELLEFDNAVQTALRFAKNNRQTALFILPDHGNSGISMGNCNSNRGYDKLPLEAFFKPLDNYKKSAYTFAKEMQNMPIERVESFFATHYGLRLTGSTRENIKKAIENEKLIPLENRPSSYMTRAITKILYDSTYIGFTTYGHTGEDVFFAGYHPANDMPLGVISNIDVNRYLCRQLNLEGKLSELTQEIFVPHSQLLDNSFKIEIKKLAEQSYRFTATKKGMTIIATSGENSIQINGETIVLRSVIVYMDKNGIFYLPKMINNYIKKQL